MSILPGASHVAILGGTHVAAGAGSTVTINQDGQGGVNSTLKDLSAASAHTAMHNSAARFDSPRCHRNTRAKYLENFELWILGEGEEFEGKRLIWLHGAAGAGKSAIMQSVSERCAQHGVILGTFFFSRVDPSRNYAEVLIPTLAYQLAQMIPESLTVLGPIVQHNPLIFKASLHIQAYELLVRPLQYLFDNGILDYTRSHRRVFVIDGLDECGDTQKQALIINVIATILCEYDLPICFLIASRPELSIYSAFEREKRLYGTFSTIDLDEDDNTDSDIRQFIEDSFLDILDNHPWRHHIKLPWPDSVSIHMLVWKSSGHFIYAATAMKFIASSKEHPVRALEVIEGLQLSRTEGPFSQLDALYMHILTSAQYAKQALAILRHCYLSDFASSVAALCYVHELSPEDIALFLSDVQSLISSSFDQMGNISIKPKHASLRDFFEDESRSQMLYMTHRDYHVSLLERYFEILDSGPDIPTPSFWHSRMDHFLFINHLATAITHSQDDNILQSLISQHAPHDIWNFCVEGLSRWETLTSSSVRYFATDATCSYMRAIRDSIVDSALYFQQFPMYIELVLDDIDDFVDRAPQHRMIPALIFSSSCSSQSIELAARLLQHWFYQFHMDHFCLCHFKLVEFGGMNHKIHPQSVEAISRLPQRQLSWSSDLVIVVKLILHQLVHLSWLGPDKLLYTSPHRQWLRRHKIWKQISLGSPRLTSILSHGFQIALSGYNEEDTFRVLKLYGNKHTLLSRWRVFRTRNWDMSAKRKNCRVLLEAVIFYLPKSDCTKEVVALARRSLPKVALWSPKLMKRAREEMDAYVCRWEDSSDSLFDRAASLSINDMD